MPGTTKGTARKGGATRSLVTEKKSASNVATKSMAPSNSVWDKVSAARGERARIPDEAFTADDYSKRFGVSLPTARRELERFVRAGKIKCAITCILCSDGKLHTGRKYWPV
jgi:hypothetical protein